MAKASSGGGGLPSYVPHQYDSWVETAAKGTGLPVDVVAAQLNEESGFNPQATSPAGAEGIAQFEPATYADSGGKGSEYVAANELAPYITLTRQNLKWAGGDVQKALAAYNAGQGNWQAGIGYANTILSNAGQGSSLKAGTPTGINPNVGKGLGGQSTGGTTFEQIWRGALAGIGVDLGQSPTQAYANAGQLDSLGGIAASITTIGASVTKLSQDIDWLFHPNHWIRILAGVGGAAFLGFGVYSMTHVGRGGQVGGSVAGVPVGVDLPSSSLPLAIGATGLGFLGLYIAFHNLPDSVGTFPDFVGYLAAEVRNPTGASNAAA